MLFLRKIENGIKACSLGFVKIFGLKRIINYFKKKLTINKLMFIQNFFKCNFQVTPVLFFWKI